MGFRAWTLSMSRCPYHQGCSSELDCPWIIPVVCPLTPNFLVRIVEWLARFDHLGPFPSSVTGPVLLVLIPASLRAFCPLARVPIPAQCAMFTVSLVPNPLLQWGAMVFYNVVGMFLYKIMCTPGILECSSHT